MRISEWSMAILITSVSVWSGSGLSAAEPAIDPATGSPADWGSPVMQSDYGQLMIDRLESGFGEGSDTRVWDAQAWYGGDYHRAWFKTEGSGEWGGSSDAGQLQALYSRRISPFWDLQIGARQDFGSGADERFLVLGLMGLAPYRLETDASLFFGRSGDISARLETEYDLRITQRLVLQPRVELTAGLAGDTRTDLLDGVDTLETGLRLRYEIRREIAPYLGLDWRKHYGKAREQTLRDGGSASRASVVLGIRMWF